MPSGIVHNGITLVSGVTISGVLAASGMPLDFVGGIAVGHVAGLMMSPDCDLDAGNRGDTLVRAVFPPAELMWDLFWWPYRKLFSHRGMSHTPFLGTATRVLYTIYINPVGASVLWPSISTFAWAWFLGLCLADLWHILADKLVSGHKRKMKAHVDYEEYRQWSRNLRLARQLKNQHSVKRTWLVILLRILQSRR